MGLLAVLVLGLAWLALELRKLNTQLSPILGSSLAQGIAAL